MGEFPIAVGPLTSYHHFGTFSGHRIIELLSDLMQRGQHLHVDLEETADPLLTDAARTSPFGNAILDLARQREELLSRVAEHGNALQLLYDVASAANEADTVDGAIHFVIQRICRHFQWSFGHAFLPNPHDPNQLQPTEMYYEGTPDRFILFREVTRRTRLAAGQGLPGRVYQSGKPEWITDIANELVSRRADVGVDLALRTAAAFPILVGEKVVGVLEVFSDQEVGRSELTLELMGSVGTQLGRVVERKRLEKWIANATAYEQQRIGRELHDTVLQQLTGIALLTEELRQRLEAESSLHETDVARLLEYTKDAQDQARRLARGLMPVAVDANGLMAALETMAAYWQESSGVPCTFQCAKPVPIDDNATATHLHRIAQEAVQNAVKHAQATSIIIHLDVDDDLTLAVSDDGIGIDGNTAKTESMGFQNMRYRAGVIGARLNVESKPGKGTTVSCSLKYYNGE